MHSGNWKFSFGVLSLCGQHRLERFSFFVSYLFYLTAYFIPLEYLNFIVNNILSRIRMDDLLGIRYY